MGILPLNALWTFLNFDTFSLQSPLLLVFHLSTLIVISSGSISCALKNTTNWEAHKVILTLSHDGNKHTCTKEANAAASATSTRCGGTVTELTITSVGESLNITADFTGDTNRVYVCSVSVDGVVDRKMIYAEKIGNIC